MKIAIIGSRNLKIDHLEDYVPKECTEIISGGAAGIDACAKQFAQSHSIPYTEFLPDYPRYKRGAPHIRNRQIVEYADVIYAFWDGKSRGTQHVIKYCKKIGKRCIIFSF